MKYDHDTLRCANASQFQLYIPRVAGGTLLRTLIIYGSRLCHFYANFIAAPYVPQV